jgi:tetratricopeptide (TPR) repeat protein
MKRNLRYDWKDSPHAVDPGILEELASDFEIDFFEEVLSKDPDHVSALISLGELYTAAGRFQEGLEVDLKLVGVFPFEPVIHYNLACSYSLLDRKEEALEALRKAVNLGYDDFETLQNDRDLENIRDHPKFLELLLSVKKD